MGGGTIQGLGDWKHELTRGSGAKHPAALGKADCYATIENME